jgi:hypothetical protein
VPRWTCRPRLKARAARSTLDLALHGVRARAFA